jgi:hypothetical protein
MVIFVYSGMVSDILLCLVAWGLRKETESGGDIVEFLNHLPKMKSQPSLWLAVVESGKGENLQIVHMFEVFAVVREQGEIVMEASGRDQEVEVVDHSLLLSHSASLFSKSLARPSVNTQHRKGSQKVIDTFSTSGRVPRGVDALEKFGQRYNAYRDSFRLEPLKSQNCRFPPVDVVDGPVGVNQIAENHNLTSFRVRTSRSA